MINPQFSKLADLLINYSCALKPGEVALIDATDIPEEFLIALMRAISRAGAIPLVEQRHSRINREKLLSTTPAHARLTSELEMHRMRKVDAFISLRGAINANEISDVASAQVALYNKAHRRVINYRVARTKWVVLRWPTPSMAQSAGMSTEAFEKLYFDVCTLDYRMMAKAMAPLKQRMKHADQVRIVSPGTDLTFSIKGIGAKECDGKRNVPDGEVFSCPVKNSVNGVIQYNTPTIYSGTKMESIRLVFKQGKVVNATGSDTTKLNEILDTDAGARYIGEFAIGFNPHILNPICDILFDEKIAGSLHIALGKAYDDCGNGNRSAVHWDMVLIQRPEWGGGEVWFDGELIRKDGMFLPKDLKPLNPANLK